MQMVNKDSNAYTVSRRDFLASAACGMAGLALPCGGRGATDLPLAGTVPSLNYWCTWAMQGMTRRLPEWHRKVAAIVGDVWHDITGALAYVDGETILPDDILAKIGREAAPADIYSSPGTLIFNKQRS